MDVMEAGRLKDVDGNMGGKFQLVYDTSFNINKFVCVYIILIAIF